MHCPKCSGVASVVYTFSDVDEVHRLRKCNRCGHKILTCEEEVPMSLITEIRRFQQLKRQARKDDACY